MVEGDRLYRRALDAGLEPKVTFVSGGERETAGDVVTVAPGVLDKASYRSQSEGVIGVFDQWETSLERLHLPEGALLLIAEDIEKPGNLGAMMRTAGAAGVDAVVTVGQTVDAFNPNVVRASTGALFSTPLAVSRWEELAPWLQHQGIRMIAATPDGDVALWESDLTGAVAIVIGAEDRGLSKRAVDLADHLVAIPQAGPGVDSLNASVAAAVLIFEASRQRAR